MIKRPVLLAVVMILSLLMGACQKATENDAKKGRAESKEVKQQPVSEGQPQMLEQGQSRPPEAITTTGAGQPETINSSSKETVPLVTEVMTKEELQAYLKEKNIPIITKENFKEPELLWEKTYEGEHIPYIQAISDVTEKGNLIIFSGKQPTAKEPHPDMRLLFIDSKGDVRKKVNIGKLSYREEGGDVVRDKYAVAASGKAAVIAHWKKGTKVVTVAYYDEEGNEVWNKDIKLNEIGKVMISNNGENIAIEEGNINWSMEEWSGELNIEKVIFLDSKGKQLFEQNNFRNIGWGEFSGDGKYFAGLFWWQKDPDTWGKLIYIDIKNGKVLWEKPFGTYGDFHERNYMAVSQKGSYVAAVDTRPAEKIDRSKQNPFDFYEIDVFDKEGKLISKFKDAYIYMITDNGLMFTGGSGGDRKQLTDVSKPRIVLRWNPDKKNESPYAFPDMRLGWFRNSNGELLLYEPIYREKTPGHFTLSGKYTKRGGGDHIVIYRLPGGQNE